MTGKLTRLHNTLPFGQSVSLRNNTYHLALSSGSIQVRKDETSQGYLSFEGVSFSDISVKELRKGLTTLMEYDPELRSINISECPSEHVDDLVFINDQGQSILLREILMQTSSSWLKQECTPFPHKQILSKQGYHPIRPKPQEGELYRRFIPELKQEISLLGVELEPHVSLFHKWQNNERVAAFWDQKGTLEEHKSYLEEQLTNHKNQLLIVCLDNEPFAYIEAYWAKEDRIAPYYHAGDYDRGIHMLVGEEHHRGAHKVAAWLPSICHYLYLSDPRVERIVSEPRADNQKMISYLQSYGFAKLKEFDFAHKRSALMCQLRDTFFTQHF